ncbi:hypothetical protein ACFYMO_00715 [Streptomyces sp. NPDC007025]|uniref:hypothetical protein n=1 Tax=Streptomyces sp. NPDC007025 TaxID=3364771 RepID=UPI0036886DB9
MTDERRERYAAAIYHRVAEFPWDAVVSEEQQYWYPYADAAMAVADEELARLRHEWYQTVMDRLAHINRLKAEIVRLREELEAAGKVARERDELSMAVRQERNEARNRVVELRTERARLRDELERIRLTAGKVPTVTRRADRG